ncbi:MAG: hypothetical protein IIU57_01965 [Oscillospiraceae bacterium]|nr:hypothetical protein [Oscillospiraceae bacterium]
MDTRDLLLKFSSVDGNSGDEKLAAKEAVSTAYAYAEEGDIVTLSPASASFDRYKNFEIRGKHFKELVSKIGQVDGLSAEELWPDYKI